MEVSTKALPKWTEANKWDGTPSRKQRWIDQVHSDLKGNPELLAVFDDGFESYTESNYNEKMMGIERNATLQRLLRRIYS